MCRAEEALQQVASIVGSYSSFSDRVNMTQAHGCMRNAHAWSLHHAWRLKVQSNDEHAPWRLRRKFEALTKRKPMLASLEITIEEAPATEAEAERLFFAIADIATRSSTATTQLRVAVELSHDVAMRGMALGLQTLICDDILACLRADPPLPRPPLSLHLSLRVLESGGAVQELVASVSDACLVLEGIEIRIARLVLDFQDAVTAQDHSERTLHLLRDVGRVTSGNPGHVIDGLTMRHVSPAAMTAQDVAIASTIPNVLVINSCAICSCGGVGSLSARCTAMLECATFLDDYTNVGQASAAYVARLAHCTRLRAITMYNVASGAVTTFDDGGVARLLADALPSGCDLTLSNNSLLDPSIVALVRAISERRPDFRVCLAVQNSACPKASVCAHLAARHLAMMPVPSSHLDAQLEHASYPALLAYLHVLSPPLHAAWALLRDPEA